MSTIKIKDANGDNVYMKATGSGTEQDPYVPINQTGDVPAEFIKQTANGETFLIQKGQLNNLRLRPQIMNEHAESSRNVISTVTGGNIVGQIFKASQDNINGINLTMESAGGVIIDNFESYANDVALQAAWIADGIEADLETSVVYEGTQSMYLNTSGAAQVGKQWAKSFTSADYTGRTLQFQMQSNKEYKDVKLKIFIEDSSGNTNSRQIVQANKDIWTKLVVSVDSLIADATPAVLTDIVKVGFLVEKEKAGSYMIIDALLSVPAGGSVRVKLWDMGAIIPTSTTTSLTDGTQYEKLGDLGISGLQESSVVIDLLGGKRSYHIDEFVAGVALEIPTNELLIPDNYYAITIHHIDTDVQVYGPNAAWVDYYNNGYAFNASDEATPIVATGADEDLMFIIFSTQEVYIYEITVVTDGIPNGGSETTVYVEDENMHRTDVLVSGIKAVPAITTMLEKPFQMTKGSKFEDEYNDDFTDDVSSINLVFQYYFIPPVVNG